MNSVAKEQTNAVATPLVTVLMPCYNASRFLADAFDSILNQSYTNLEILAIDDGSTDGTANIISHYASLDSRIKPHFNEMNMGLIKTLNKGCQLANGKYIARMDSDDISMPNRVELLVQELERDLEVDLVSAGCFTLSESGHRLERVFPKACTSKALKFVSFFCTPVLHPCVVFRTSLVRDEPFDEEYLHSEDYEIFSRLLLKGKRFRNLEEPLYLLRNNSQSVSHRYESIQISTHNRISFRNINEYFLKQYDYFVQRVMTNRINFNVPPALIKQSMRNLDGLRSIFIEKEKLSPTEIADLDGFLVEQYIDIHLQSLKNSFGLLRLYHVWSCLSDIHLFVSKRGIRYLRSKTWLKR
ncbi:MAG: glycosyltransferase family 2 protein [Bacteroidota bacterium]|jgi:glycosyltransferase involved in cell wall biosynthesis